MPKYNPSTIEPRWQQYWEENNTFESPAMPEGEKLYVLDMFPYPSGDGLHVGHPEGYTATDITCRFERMRGKSVLHPMGFDAFGLPAEEHAILTNTPPRVQTEKNIKTFTRQLKMLGFSYDWNRVLATTDVHYFRWTQWILLLLFDSWFDPASERGRPISELPIPDDVQQAGATAVREYQDDHRLAFQADALVNWCPALGTVLANEEVVDGLSERGQHPVERLPLRQWMLRITAYADRLEQDLEGLDWPDGIKKLQRDWIGQSHGAEVDFFIGPEDSFEQWKRERAESSFPRKPDDSVLRIYTTRPDTLFGATYMVLAPEHPFVQRLTTSAQRDDVEAYCQKTASKSDRERTEENQGKTGVFTGATAINPVNGEPIPIWIADYVLASYGTGAIMAVPAHDDRDHEFAIQFELPIVTVVEPVDQADVDPGTCFSGEGLAVHSGPYDGLSTAEFKQQIARSLQEQGYGREAVNYKLRDWLFSRQRFWGEPFPILHELDEDGQPNGMIRAVPEDQLPVDLPEIEDYKPHGRPEPPLTKAPEEWLYPVIDGVRYRRETNTMPQWAGSCWYFLRFIDPHNSESLVDLEKEKAWMPVDLYIGGAEHAVLHLLYARFWHKVLFDRGHVSTNEPFQRLVNQGMILGEMEFTGYQDEQGEWVSRQQVRRNEDRQAVHREDERALQETSLGSHQVTKEGDTFVLVENQQIQVESRAYKMSKSRGNVVNPDEIVNEYGADSLRLYEMFMGPLVAAKPWSMAGVNGVRNFLDRAWRMIVDNHAEKLQLHEAVQDVSATEDQLRVLHKTIKAVTADTDSLSFNTAIARMMEFVNFFTGQESRPLPVMKQFILLLSPYAPHIGEELWQLLGAETTLAYEPWPEFDESLTVDSQVEIPVQVQGKLRSRIKLPADSTAEELEAAARLDKKIASLLAEVEVVKVITVPGKLVNFVVK
ncbi:MAG: leucine--tRNA ligase [Pirellulaceae bacterium]